MRTFSKFHKAMRIAPSSITSLLVISVVAMNLLANKEIKTNIEWLGLDCGILFSAISFLSMDILTQRFGLFCANSVCIYALFINILTSIIFFFASLIPGAWAESFIDGSNQIINNALDNTFRGTWFIILGSSIAFLVSGLTNNFINNKIGKLLKNNKNFSSFAFRSYISTFTAQFVDNIIFALLVSKIFFDWSFVKCFSCAITGAVLELIFEILISPIGYKLSRKFESVKIEYIA